MAELGIGVLFAILFVTAYLFISRLGGKGGHVCGRWRELFGQDYGCGRSLDEKRPRLFLTASEMSEHHSQTGRGRSK